MFTELIDALRCPQPHEDSWLVATSSQSANRHILHGLLGCPVCRRTYPIVDGVARFGDGLDAVPVSPLADDAVFRLAAQLHLVEAPAPILLIGAWSCAAEPLRRMLPHVSILVGDASAVPVLDDKLNAVRLPTSSLPFAAGAMRGVALSPSHLSDAMLSECARVVRAGGRLVAPPDARLDTAAWRQLARDADVVVAERLPAASAPVQLRRAPVAPLFTA
jgi:uncharacterized protein YbaR (Trm112 family)